MTNRADAPMTVLLQLHGEFVGGVFQQYLRAAQVTNASFYEVGDGTVRADVRDTIPAGEHGADAPLSAALGEHLFAVLKDQAARDQRAAVLNAEKQAAEKDARSHKQLADLREGEAIEAKKVVGRRRAEIASLKAELKAERAAHEDTKREKDILSAAFLVKAASTAA